MEKHKVVEYAGDADLDNPYEHCAHGISEWPAYGDMQPMPVVRPLVPFQSNTMFQLGFRYHPELATLFKIPDPLNPGVSKFVSREEYEELLAAGGGKVEEGAANAKAFELLAKLDPELAESLASMSEADRAAERDKRAADAKDALRVLAEAGSKLEVKPE